MLCLDIGTPPPVLNEPQVITSYSITARFDYPVLTLNGTTALEFADGDPRITYGQTDLGGGTTRYTRTPPIARGFMEYTIEVRDGYVIRYNYEASSGARQSIECR